MDKPTPSVASRAATTPRPAASHPPCDDRSSPPAPRRLYSTELFDGEQQIEIAHGDAVYRLRRTALGKLILTK